VAVAAGAALPFAQSDVTVSGHAIEARLCAERPRQDYRPTPGTATHVRWPVGVGLRTDAGIESGSAVSPFYDSLVAKVMARGEDRPGAVARLARALVALEVDGLETNRELLAAVLADPVFVGGEARIDFLDSRRDLRDAALGETARRRHASAAAAALLVRRAASSVVPVPGAGWRNVGTAHHVDTFSDATGPLEVRSGSPDRPLAVLEGDQWVDVGPAQAADGVVDLTADGVRRRYRVRLDGQHAEVNGPEGQSSFIRRTEDDPDPRGGLAGECRAPLPGAVTKVLVAVGDEVAGGAGLVVLEAMKMEHTLRTAGAGTVARVQCAPGDQVDVGDLLVVVEPA